MNGSAIENSYITKYVYQVLNKSINQSGDVVVNIQADTGLEALDDVSVFMLGDTYKLSVLWMH